MSKIRAILLLIIFLCSSCATLLNLPEEKISIITDEPARISTFYFHSDTLSENINLIVPRSSNPLKLSVTSAYSTNNYLIKPKNSFAYWLNIYPLVGFFVDKHNPKRYSYPRSVYINTHDTSNNYLTHEPLDSATAKRNNIIKFIPLRLFALSNSGIELRYERKTGSQFSTELMGTYLLSSNIFDEGGFRPNIRGYRFGIEEKLYLHNTALIGPYLCFGINHLETHYDYLAEFGPKGINNRDNNISETYSDSIKIHKRTTDFNLIFGYQKKAGRIMFDYYCGFGIRNRNVIHRNRINPDDEMVSPIDLNFNYSSNVERKNTTPILLLGIKVGWIF